MMTGLEFPQISPIMFSIGPLVVRWYSMAYLIGILAGWYLLNRNIRKNDLGLNKQNAEDLVFYLTLGIILGGRLGYAVFYGGRAMWEEPWHILEIWKGGMSFHGGVLGVIAATWRQANFVNDELWGRVTDVPWAVRFPAGGYLPRHPSQLYEAFFEGLVMFTVLNLLWRSKWVRGHHGLVSSLFVVLYGIFRILMEQFREPDAHMGFFFTYFTMGQILSLPLIVIGLAVIWYSHRKYCQNQA